MRTEVPIAKITVVLTGSNTKVVTDENTLPRRCARVADRRTETPATPIVRGDQSRPIPVDSTDARLQIDTISVVARSPYLVLWSRLSDYQMSWLDELLAEGALFEYWSHAACFLPREDYPLSCIAA